MRFSWKERLLAMAMAVTVASTGISVPVNAEAAPDGKTEAASLAEKMQKTEEWNKWQKEWETLKSDWTQISLTPGANSSELNFAWYSKKAENTPAPKLKIGEGEKMANEQVYTATQIDVNDEKDSTGANYVSNKVTATGLKANTTYYYCYEKDGAYTTPQKYQTRTDNNYSFIFVGDPQIGSSNELKGTATEEFYNAQSASVMSDAFNWEITLNQAMLKTEGKASFVVSAGDQIQTTKKKAPNKDAANSEIEYAGYLSPDVLKSLPVATTVGNHDADNANYTYHFNTPNNSELGSNGIVGGDYYFSYGNTLFMMLNTQDTNVAEHKQFIEEAVAANKDCKWRIVTLHQDIYGSAEHSNEPEITNLRYQLVPYFEANDIDVVLTGHDHAYSRSKLLIGGKSTVEYTDNQFDEMLEQDMDAGESPQTLTTAPGNIENDTTNEDEKAYLNYLNAVMDKDAVETIALKDNTVENPEGILYMTANSSSGSKYYDLVPRMQSYIASRWQEDVPTYSVIMVTDDSFTIDTYRTDTNEKIDESFTIKKTEAGQKEDDDKKQDENKQEESSKPISIESAGITAISDQTYTGSAVEPAVEVKVNDKVLQRETDYTVSYESNVNVGTATVKVIGKNGYTGNKTATFKIVPKEVSLAVDAISNQTYTGKEIKPSVVVKADGKTLAVNTDYTVTYTSNVNTGLATVTVEAKGNYKGTGKTTFKIVPKKITISAKSKKKGQITLSCKKAAGKVSGYTISYATKANLKNAKTVSTGKAKYTLKSLKSGKTYYVRARAYKKISGKKVYGQYSKTIKVKVK